MILYVTVIHLTDKNEIAGTSFWLQCSDICRVYLIASFLVILPEFFSMGTCARLLEILALVQWNLSFKSL